jgi:hypothetical protein
MIAVMNVPKMEVAPASAAAAAEGFPEHMGALSVGIDHGYGKVEDVREQHAKELQRDKKNDEAKAEAAAAKAPLEAVQRVRAVRTGGDPDELAFAHRQNVRAANDRPLCDRALCREALVCFRVCLNLIAGVKKVLEL